MHPFIASYLLSFLFLCVKTSTLSPEDVEYCASSEVRGQTYEGHCQWSNDSGICPLDYTALDICCTCFNICCPSDDDGSTNLNVTITLPVIRVQAQATKNGTIMPVKDTQGVLRGVTGAVGGTLSALSEVVGSIRIRRAGASKTSRGTGEDVVDEEETDMAQNDTGTLRKELENAIGTAVRIALNKLATTLKNVTEMEEPVSKENDTSTTIAPPVESCSSKSKRCEEQEPDLLDEFFPPKNSGKTKGKGRRRRAQDSVLVNYNFRTLEIKNGQDFGSSGGLITKGQIPDTWSQNRSIISLQSGLNLTTTEESTSDETTEATVTGNDKHRNMTFTKSKTVQGSKGNRNKTQDDLPSGSSPRPSLVTSSLLVPNVKPGKCEILNNGTCISLQPDASQCALDSECEGTRKCCFYGCKPYNKIGICAVPVFY